MDAVCLSVGGGGLLIGIIAGLQRHNLHIPVIAVETEGAASLHTSIQSKELITLDSITSIATTLGARTVSAEALRLSLSYPTHSVLVTDQQALDACLLFASQHRVLVEASCGAAISAPFVHRALFDELGIKQPLIVVCGGSNIPLSLSLSQ